MANKKPIKKMKFNGDLHFRVTQAEKEALEQFAIAHGATCSYVIRTAVKAFMAAAAAGESR